MRSQKKYSYHVQLDPSRRKERKSQSVPMNKQQLRSPSKLAPLPDKKISKKRNSLSRHNGKFARQEWEMEKQKEANNAPVFEQLVTQAERHFDQVTRANAYKTGFNADAVMASVQLMGALSHADSPHQHVWGPLMKLLLPSLFWLDRKVDIIQLEPVPVTEAPKKELTAIEKARLQGKGRIFKQKASKVQVETPLVVKPIPVRPKVKEEVTETAMHYFDHVEELNKRAEKLRKTVGGFNKRLKHLAHHEGRNGDTLNNVVLRWQLVAKRHAFTLWKSNVTQIKNQRKKLTFFLTKLNQKTQTASIIGTFKRWKIVGDQRRLNEIRPDVESIRENHTLAADQDVIDSKDTQDAMARLEAIVDCELHYRTKNSDFETQLQAVLTATKASSRLSVSMCVESCLKLVGSELTSMYEEFHRWAVDDLRQDVARFLLSEEQHMHVEDFDLEAMIHDMRPEDLLMKWLNFQLNEQFVLRKGRAHTIKQDVEGEEDVDGKQQQSEQQKKKRKKPLQCTNFDDDFASGKVLLALLEVIAPTNELRLKARRSLAKNGGDKAWRKETNVRVTDLFHQEEDTKDEVQSTKKHGGKGKGKLHVELLNYLSDHINDNNNVSLLNTIGVDVQLNTNDDLASASALVDQMRCRRALMIVSQMMTDVTNAQYRRAFHKNKSYSYLLSEYERQGNSPGLTSHFVTPHKLQSRGYGDLVAAMVGRLFIAAPCVTLLDQSYDRVLEDLEKHMALFHQMDEKMQGLIRVREEMMNLLRRKEVEIRSRPVEIDKTLEVYTEWREGKNKEAVIQSVLDTLKDKFANLQEDPNENITAMVPELVDKNGIHDSFKINVTQSQELEARFRRNAESVHATLIDYLTGLADDYHELRLEVSREMDRSRKKYALWALARDKIKKFILETLVNHAFYEPTKLPSQSQPVSVIPPAPVTTQVNTLVTVTSATAFDEHVVSPIEQALFHDLDWRYAYNYPPLKKKKKKNASPRSPNSSTTSSAAQSPMTMTPNSKLSHFTFGATVGDGEQLTAAQTEDLENIVLLFESNESELDRVFASYCNEDEDGMNLQSFVVLMNHTTLLNRRVRMMTAQAQPNEPSKYEIVTWGIKTFTTLFFHAARNASLPSLMKLYQNQGSIIFPAEEAAIPKNGATTMTGHLCNFIDSKHTYHDKRSLNPREFKLETTTLTSEKEGFKVSEVLTKAQFYRILIYVARLLMPTSALLCKPLRQILNVFIFKLADMRVRDQPHVHMRSWLNTPAVVLLFQAYRNSLLCVFSHFAGFGKTEVAHKKGHTKHDTLALKLVREHQLKSGKSGSHRQKKKVKTSDYTSHANENDITEIEEHMAKQTLTLTGFLEIVKAADLLASEEAVLELAENASNTQPVGLSRDDVASLFANARFTLGDVVRPSSMSLLMPQSVTDAFGLGKRSVFEMSYPCFLEALLALAMTRYPDPFQPLVKRLSAFLQHVFLPKVLPAVRHNLEERVRSKAK